MRRAPLLCLLALAALPLPALAQGGSITETLGGKPGGGALGEAPTSQESQTTAQLFSTLCDDPQSSEAELQMFLTMMPKGADLHHHYSGSIYAETYLDWVKQAGWKIDPQTLQIDRDGKVEGSLSVDEVYADPELYRELLSAWSIKDYDNHDHGQAPPDAAFFKTFALFGPISTFAYDQGLKKLRDRALAENVQYIETMLAGVRYWFSDEQADARLEAAQGPALEQELGALCDHFAADWKLKKAVDGFVSMVEKNHAGIDSDAFTLRYQSYVYRDNTPSRVFAGLYGAFAAADQSDLVVGVNMVGPENGRLALRDYTLHMQMVGFLKQRFPKVHVALHAGELVKGMVPPEDLRFHIRQAVELGGAERIGHAIDLPHETQPIGLMRLLKERDIPVEINLTSNAFILGVEGREHPLNMFRANHVPLVICTDDSGVSRNDLSHEYMLLATRYHLSYAELKQLVMNGVSYAFAAEPTKVRLRALLDQRFAAFEHEMADYQAQRSQD